MIEMFADPTILLLFIVFEPHTASAQSLTKGFFSHMLFGSSSEATITFTEAAIEAILEPFGSSSGLPKSSKNASKKRCKNETFEQRIS